MQEVKVNKDIAEYEENVFFGLTLRQLGWGVLAVAAAVSIYVLTNLSMGETASALLAILAAAPFACLAFLKWHGLSAYGAAKKILRALKAPRKLCFRSTTMYLDAVLEKKRKKGKQTLRRKK